MAKGDLVEKTRAKRNTEYAIQEKTGILDLTGTRLDPYSSLMRTSKGKAIIACVRKGHCQDCHSFEAQSEGNGWLDQCKNEAYDKMQVMDIKTARRMNIIALCYVCGEGVVRTENYVMLPADATSDRRYCHDDCRTGTDKWLSKVPPSEGTISAEVRRIYEMARSKKEAEKPKKVAKEKVAKVALTTEDISTLGRIKYMAYMDSVLIEAKEERPTWEIKGANFEASSAEGHSVKIKVNKSSHVVAITQVADFINNVKKGMVPQTPA